MRRRADVPPHNPAGAQLDLPDRLRLAATRLEAMPPELASSLSVTVSSNGRAEADLRALALTVSAPLGLEAQVDAGEDAITVTFRRPIQRRR
jgi:hypothetical protein